MMIIMKLITILKTILIITIINIMIIIVIKFNNKLKRKIQGQNRFWVDQTTVNTHKNIWGKNSNNSNRKLKAKVNITPITNHCLRNGQMGDTNPKSCMPY